jgi:tight adherence protein C
MTTLLSTFLLFVIVTASFTYLGVKLWIRPKQAIDRVAGVRIEQAGAIAETHPSAALRELLHRLGSMLPANPRDVSIMQRKLIRAGYRSPNALRVLYGTKVVCGIAFPLVALALAARSGAEAANQLLGVIAAGGLGFLGPNQYIKFAGDRRQHQIRRGLPNALDLLVVCVESGLGLDQAILQVAKELEHAHPEISEEFGLVNLELRAGKRRAEALRNLAERANVEELKKLVAVLIQADRFGTGIAQSLRGHADFMRIQARQKAEEKAAKLGVKLVFPIFFCILPSLFIVTVGPIAVTIVRELLPTMQSM